MSLSNHIYDMIFFPGIAIHEIGHIAGCKISGVKVKKYSLLNFGGDSKPVGYVKTGASTNKQDFLIGLLGHVFPLSVMLISAFIAFTVGASSYFLGAILIWLSYTCLVHSIPTKNDLEKMGLM